MMHEEGSVTYADVLRTGMEEASENIPPTPPTQKVDAAVNTCNTVEAPPENVNSNIQLIGTESIVRGRWDVIQCLSPQELEQAFLPAIGTGWTLLHASVVSQDKDIINKLFDLCPAFCRLYINSFASRAGTTRWTPLHLAIRHKNKMAITKLLSEGADVNIRFQEPASYRQGSEAEMIANDVHIHPLSLAALHGDLEVFKMICEVTGPEWLTITDELQRSLLYWVVKNFEDEVIQKRLLDYLLNVSPDLVFSCHIAENSPILRALALPRMSQDNIMMILEYASKLHDSRLLEHLFQPIKTRHITAMHYAVASRDYTFMKSMFELLPAESDQLSQMDRSLIIRALGEKDKVKACAIIEELVYPVQNTKQRDTYKNIVSLISDRVYAVRSIKLYGPDRASEFLKEAEIQLKSNPSVDVLSVFLNAARSWSRQKNCQILYKQLKECHELLSKTAKKSYKH